MGVFVCGGSVCVLECFVVGCNLQDSTKVNLTIDEQNCQQGSADDRQCNQSINQ